MIYLADGSASEYSELALNMYAGCDNECYYCYNKRFWKSANSKKYALDRLRKQVANYSFNDDLQIFMSFATDPYTKLNDSQQLTRQALEILLPRGYKLAILTKNGSKLMSYDIDYLSKFKSQVKIGTTLTYKDDSPISVNAEKGTDSQFRRLEFLELAKYYGMTTFVSLEPVISHLDVIENIDLSQRYTDYYLVGKMNYQKGTENLPFILDEIIKRLRGYKKRFYIKKSLQEFDFQEQLTDDEKNCKLFHNFWGV